MKNLMKLVNQYKGTNLSAPLAVGVRNSMAMSLECGSGTAGGYGNCSDCNCSECMCYECYESN